MCAQEASSEASSFCLQSFFTQLYNRNAALATDFHPASGYWKTAVRRRDFMRRETGWDCPSSVVSRLSPQSMV